MLGDLMFWETELASLQPVGSRKTGDVSGFPFAGFLFTPRLHPPELCLALLGLQRGKDT